MLSSMHPLETDVGLLRTVEAMGVDAIWLPDHMLGYAHPDLPQPGAHLQSASDPDGFLDPFCVHAALAAQTELPLGIAVTDSTRRRAPDVARSALTLHHMCRGGFNLGIGSGEAESLVPFGYPFDKPVGRCEEFLAELRCLLDTGRMPQGGPGRIGVPLESAMGKPKLWVAGHGPRMLRLTGQYADGWLPAWR
ncbi:MAG: LLM class flavin-dependent oxidoreductase, partial [Deltaproteobacteria bacterium]|nr:LLM class flavin-dependent oxidoreductase [Deltaproteobacteria bacterium]